MARITGSPTPERIGTPSRAVKRTKWSMKHRRIVTGIPWEAYDRRDRAWVQGDRSEKTMELAKCMQFVDEAAYVPAHHRWSLLKLMAYEAKSMRQRQEGMRVRRAESAEAQRRRGK